MSAAAPVATALRCEVLQENLLRALQLVRPVVADRSVHPATSSVLLKSAHGRLAVTATDRGIAVTTWIGARVHEDGASTIGYRRLADWVKWLGPVAMQLRQEPKRLTVSGTGFSLSGYTLPAEDFPRLPGVENPQLELEFRGPETLRAAARRVVLHAAQDDSRPVLTGVLVEVNGRNVTLVGADGFRLDKEHVKASGKGAMEGQWIIPARAMGLLPKLMPGSEPITLRLSPTVAEFEQFDVRLTSQVIQGTYRSYSKLIPAERATEVLFDAEEMLRAVRLAGAVAVDGPGIIRLELGADGVDVSSRAADDVLIAGRQPDAVSTATIRVPCALSGPPNRIAFNWRYLSEVLAREKGRLVFGMEAPSSAGVFRFGERRVAILMPMLVQW